MSTASEKLKKVVVGIDRRRWAWGAAAVAVQALLPTLAWAGSALPWDTGLSAISSTLTGTVAIGVGTIALATVGIAHAVGADLGGATKGTVAVVIIISMVGAASQLVGNIGVSGGLLP